MRIQKRNNKGNAILFGTCSAVVIVALSVCLSTLIVSAGCLSLGSEKLDRANRKATQFAIAHVQDPNLEIETEFYAADVLSQMQVAPSCTSVNIDDRDGSNLQVKLSNSFQILGAGGLIPHRMLLSNVQQVRQSSNY